MPAIEVDGLCEAEQILENSGLELCKWPTVMYYVTKDERTAKVCKNCVNLAEDEGWKSSFIEWRDS